MNKQQEQNTFDDHIDESLFDEEERDLICGCTTAYDEDEYRAVCDERDEWKNKYLYAIAEIENLKKHHAEAVKDVRWTSSARILHVMLDIADDFERAVYSREHLDDPMPEDVHRVYEGFSLIYKKLTDTLDTIGCKKMLLRPGNDNYVAFDTDRHEAVGTFPNRNPRLDNMIVDVQQEGYTYDGRVLRYAKVIVGKYVADK